MVETVRHKHPPISIKRQMAGSVQQVRGPVPCRVFPEYGQTVSAELKNTLETNAGPTVTDKKAAPRSFDRVMRGIHVPRETHPSKEGRVWCEDLENVRPAFSEEGHAAFRRHGNGEWFPQTGHPAGGLGCVRYVHLPDTAARVIGDVEAGGAFTGCDVSGGLHRWKDEVFESGEGVLGLEDNDGGRLPADCVPTVLKSCHAVDSTIIGGQTNHASTRTTSH